ncbi:tRNA uridine-5-carboxymethylaminomethyl(34) synthesis GTPase MnmE [Bacteroidales bacterium OttesenSCG-928-B11]|nr:tRNA uridine-5-carboxymethylaminomethyl(34) synthesis GTPase MnmE [Bacteroidales bacterium OttesenSCG-928-E04]MDL2311912.1 tRNA uridine-5-carboxymethylaminomethyl(34) synthesis GTPase MnmE [Bacteroidales bacterium OttesenSCG-928-B11]
MNREDTICAISSPQGIGAIALIRISGEKAFSITGKYINKNADFQNIPTQFAKFAEFTEQQNVIDQVVVTKFVHPHSYTGEDLVEISCHGSSYIQQKILELLIEGGARLALPGEFTMRAFLNGKMDLPQAEAVADLIESQSEITHKLAMKQLKGRFSKELHELHQQFVNFASLLELELDFSEEDVQFADRLQLSDLLIQLREEVESLLRSFKLGNVLKTGIPVAIIGKPNVGKSTLLNALVDDDRAIVSNIPGTTRDTIEDTYNIDGITFRFIDTAGIRSSEDEIENFGIERTYKAIEKADIILHMVDITQTSLKDIETELRFLEDEIDLANKKLIIIANKIDQMSETPHHFTEWGDYDVIYTSARRKVNLNLISDTLIDYVRSNKLADTTLLTNARHYDIMLNVLEAIDRIEDGFRMQLPSDLITIEVRSVLHNLGLALGETTSEDILENIFGRFCIGK